MMVLLSLRVLFIVFIIVRNVYVPTYLSNIRTFQNNSEKYLWSVCKQDYGYVLSSVVINVISTNNRKQIIK